MGTITSLPIIIFINKLIKINADINGHWITYLYALIQLWFRRRSNKSRFTVHSVWKNEPTHAGILPFDHEWDYELPSKVSQFICVLDKYFHLKHVHKCIVAYEVYIIS